jgi:hypothetical protein
LNFSARVGDEQARCGQMFSGLGTTSQNAEIMDMRLYVTNVRLVTEDGREVALELEQDGQFQVENVALLDFEDATAGCGDAALPRPTPASAARCRPAITTASCSTWACRST